MVWTPQTSNGRETDKIRFAAWPYTGGKGLDIGSGDCKVIPHALGVDTMRYAGAPIGDLCEDGATIPSIALESQDFVYSSHYLEHVRDYKAALARWWSVLKPVGFLVLYLPHRDFYPRIGQPGSNTDHKHDFHPDDIKKAVLEIAGEGNCSVLEDEDRNDANEYSFFLVFRKQNGGGKYMPGVLRDKERKEQGIKSVCIARYGAIGDMALVASVVAGYKKQNYHVVLHTSPSGAQLMREDPNIDEIYPFETDGSFFVGTLEPFWGHLSLKYDVFVNLTQSVEGTLLPSHEHMHHMYPLETRKRLLNKNYMEHAHDIANLPYEFDLKFYPTPEGIEWATAIVDRFAIMLNGQRAHHVLGVCLAGSSINKVYPFTQMVVARLMIKYQGLRVILFGGPEDARTEDVVFRHATALGIDGMRFMRCVKDQYDIRKSLALSQQCDILLGPETGIMQWNAMENNHKIVMLSHSTHENLTKHWINTTPLAMAVPCGPCHRKHNDWMFCTKGHTGASACMEFPIELLAEVVSNAISTKRTNADADAAATANWQPITASHAATGRSIDEIIESCQTRLTETFGQETAAAVPSVVSGVINPIAAD